MSVALQAEHNLEVPYKLVSGSGRECIKPCSPHLMRRLERRRRCGKGDRGKESSKEH